MATSAIRFYESAGLIQAERSEGNQRRYDASAVQALRYVDFAKSAGFTLAEIKTLICPPEPGEPLFAHWQSLAEQKLQELDEVIRRAEEMKRQLRVALECRCTATDECGLIRVEKPC